MSNIEKDIQNIKDNSIKGFILVDFPTNINQCNLLEYYLNGYIDETKKPKSQKMINIQDINSLIDFNFQPNENNKIKKAGIDFIINIIANEEDINERFNNIKYDPLNDKIYSEYELNQEIINKDKKLMERLVDNIPYYSKEHFDYYKKEYNENISKINLFYNMFGFDKNDLDMDSNIINIENNENINKTYQEINLKEDIKKVKELINNPSNEGKKQKRKSISIINNNNNKDLNQFLNKEDEIKNKIMTFINDNIIKFLYEDKYEKDIKIFYTKFPELNEEEEKDRIKFEPEYKINEIRAGQTSLKNNKHKYYMKILMDNFDSVLSDLKLFNNKYEKLVGKFIYLIKKQKNSIYVRLNLIQKKYRDFLNQKSDDKKNIINIYCNKYNKFLNDYPNAFNSSETIQEFSNNIDELNDSLWFLINIKETVSKKELQEIKNSSFIEFELKKFYKNIKEIFLLETEKFLVMINSIINLYKKNNDESTSAIINLIKNSNDKEKDKKLNQNNNIYKKEYIFKDLIEISNSNIFEENYENEVENLELNNNKNDNNQNIKNNNVFYKKKNEPISIDYIINKNVEIMFNNSLNLILSQEEKIDNLLKSVKEWSAGFKKSIKIKKKISEPFGNSMTTGLLHSKENTLEENIKKMFQNEKNKYKYRISFLRSFVSKFMVIIIQTSIKLFQNIDNWIIKSVILQSEAQNKLIQELRNILNEKRLINEEKDIHSIELDTFEPVVGDNENSNGTPRNELKIYHRLNIDYLINDDFINIDIKEDEDYDKDALNKNNFEATKYKIILPNRIINKMSCNNILTNLEYNKYNYNYSEKDFQYNLEKFVDIYNIIKKFEIKKDIINQDIFYEIFIKKYLFNKEIYNNENTNNNNNKNSNNQNQNLNNNAKIIIDNINNNENNNLNNDLNKKLKKINNLPIICKALRNLNSKNIQKLFSFFKINIDNEYDIENEKKEKTEIINTENNDNENLEKEKEISSSKIEYDNYINNSEIFTLLSLIGCKVLTNDKEKEMLTKLKNIIINDRFLSKNDYYKYNFWFESDFEYLNKNNNNNIIINNINNNTNKLKRSTITKTKTSLKKSERKNTKPLINSTLILDKIKKFDENKNNQITIKDFLFNIWKDEKGNNFNFKEFLNLLKGSKYKSNLEEFREDRYFELIFNE